MQMRVLAPLLSISLGRKTDFSTVPVEMLRRSSPGNVQVPLAAVTTASPCQTVLADAAGENPSTPSAMANKKHTFRIYSPFPERAHPCRGAYLPFRNFALGLLLGTVRLLA